MCIGTIGAYSCVCHGGYTGENCDVNVDDCAASPCQHGTCVDHTNFYECVCHAGYTGSHCSVEIEECSSDPCVHGTCLEGLDSYRCQCEDTYDGRHCDLTPTAEGECFFLPLARYMHYCCCLVSSVIV